MKIQCLTVNNEPCKVIGVGTIKIKMFDGVIRTVSSVCHVLNIRRNLISLSASESSGRIYSTLGGFISVRIELYCY